MITYHIMAPFMFLWYRLRTGERFDIVQGVGGNFLLADIVYSQFCHLVYLRDHVASRPKEPVRRIYSFIYDRIVSLLEPIIYKRANHIVTPSKGLAGELQENFDGATKAKISLQPN